MPDMRHRSKAEWVLIPLQLIVIAMVVYAAIAAGAYLWLTNIGLGLITFVLTVMAIGSDSPAKRITCGALAALCVVGVVVTRLA
jgi:hypothetical protein